MGRIAGVSILVVVSKSSGSGSKGSLSIKSRELSPPASMDSRGRGLGICL